MTVRRRVFTLFQASLRSSRLLSSWFREARVWDWLFAARRPAPQQTFRRVRLGCEILEAREVPSISTIAFVNTDVFGYAYKGSFVGEGRIGNAATNGTHEIDVNETTSGPFSAGETKQLAWLNSNSYEFQFKYDESDGIASMKIGSQEAQSVQSFTPTYDDDTLLIRTVSARAGSSIEITDLQISYDSGANWENVPNPDGTGTASTGSAYGTGLGATDKDLLQIAGVNLRDDFILKGNVKLSWDPSQRPTNSNLAFLVSAGTWTPPVVSIAATDPNATEAGTTTGQYTITRTGPTTQALTVQLKTPAGSATSGSDYSSLPTAVTIAAGQSTATITVTPVDDTDLEGDETVVLALAAANFYTIGSNSSATVTIQDSDAEQLSVYPRNVDCGCSGPTNINSPVVGDGTCKIDQNSSKPVRYADGVVKINAFDLSSDGIGANWGQTRSWSNGAGYSSGQFNGSGWVVSQQPRLIQVDGTDVVAIVLDGQTALFFNKQTDGSYLQQFAGSESFAYDSGSDLFRLTTGNGDVVVFGGFSSSLPQFQRGQFLSMTTAGGITTQVTAWGPEGRILETRVTAGSLIESYQHSYLTEGVNLGLISGVTLRRSTNGGSTWDTVRSVEYAYYDGTTSGGNAGDLMSATIKDDNGDPISTDFYRYYKLGDANGYQHGLKFVVSGDSYDRLVADVGDPLTATDTQVATYANHYFEYDASGRATEEVASGAGCSVCSGGQGTFTFTYTASSNADGPNSWKTKTVETLPDGNQNIVYTNVNGDVMLKVFKDTTTNQEWATYTRFDANGRALFRADPSAVTGYDDSYADLVHFVSGNAQYLSDTAGQFTIFDYYASNTATTTTPGGAKDFLESVALRHGETGTDILQQSMDYIANTAGGNTVYKVNSDTVYRNDDGTGAITTEYTYTYFSGTNQIESVVTTLPVISTAQNGSGTASVVETVVDSQGRPIWTMDPAGVLTYIEYDPATGAAVKMIADVDITQTSDFANLPSGWTTPSGAGKHQITTMEVDNLGRETKRTDSDGVVTYTVYNDAAHEMRVYAGWNATTNTPTGPTIVYREDRALGYAEVLTMTTAPDLDGNDLPTGTEAIDDLVSLSRDLVNDVGQVIETRDYFDFTGMSYSSARDIGTVNTNYYSTQYAYDNHGLLNKTVTPSGTIYRTFYDGLGRAVSEWVGIDDTPTTGFWSPSNPAGMTQVSAYEYDQGGVGDSNLTKSIAYSGSSSPDIVTEYAYDWRNRLVGTKAGVETTEATDVNRPISIVEYDNLNNVVNVRNFDGDGLDLVDGSADLQVPASGLLRAQTNIAYDDWGRAFRTEVDNVDPTTGTVGSNPLTSETWFDERGLVRKQATPNSATAKYEYDSLGRLTAAYSTDATNDTDYADALSISDDTVLSQTELGYDDGNRVIETTQRERDLTATGTGVLGDMSSGVAAVVYHSANYFDPISGRFTDSLNVGTNGGSAWTRPTSVPTRSNSELVTSVSYGSDGYVQDVTDPNGIVNRTDRDALGRTTETIEDFGGSGHKNKTVQYGYGPAGMTSLTAVNPTTGDQTTEWVFGITQADGNAIDSNDIVGATRHPDPTTGAASSSEEDSPTIDALGRTLTSTDRNGTVHEYSYDALGRLTVDEVTTLGSGVDGSVMKRTIGYDGQGNASVFTSYDASNTVVNQVVREFNGFGQVTREYQAAAGAVNTSTTPFVQYDYSEADTGNHSRLTKITYPDGYELDYNYATGVDDNISRLTSISDASGTLEAYSYQGDGTVLTVGRTQPGLDLTTTLDDFGRISDFNWTNSGGSVSRYAYGYDAAGNRLYKEDKVNTGLSELYGYDNLYQLTSFTRGTLNSTKDAITGTPDYTQSWNHDALGNWDDVTTNGVTEDRDSNAQNEYTDVDGNSPAYDANGNMTTDQTGKHFVWDAWNRLVEVQDASSVTLKTYTYDALNRRVTDSDGTTTKNLYYSTSWQVVLESEGEPTGTTTGMTRYVWSPVYVDAMILRDRDADNDGDLEERLWAVQDANFNMVALVDNSGNVVERYKYTPFGVVTVTDASGTVLSGSAYGWVYLHQGLRYEEASGLYDNRFRWYSATLGQFVSNDPLGFAAGDVNVRRYVGNEPVDARDPSGLDQLNERDGNAYMERHYYGKFWRWGRGGEEWVGAVQEINGQRYIAREGYLVPWSEVEDVVKTYVSSGVGGDWIKNQGAITEWFREHTRKLSAPDSAGAWASKGIPELGIESTFERHEGVDRGLAIQEQGADALKELNNNYGPTGFAPLLAAGVFPIFKIGGCQRFQQIPKHAKGGYGSLAVLSDAAAAKAVNQAVEIKAGMRAIKIKGDKTVIFRSSSKKPGTDGHDLWHGGWIADQDELKEIGRTPLPLFRE